MQITRLLEATAQFHESTAACAQDSANKKRRITVSSNGVSFSNMIGNRACNRRYFESAYPDLSIRFTVDDSLPDMTFRVSEL